MVTPKKDNIDNDSMCSLQRFEQSPGKNNVPNIDLSSMLRDFQKTGEEARIRSYFATISQVKQSELKDARENCLKLKQMVNANGRDFIQLHRRLRTSQSNHSELRTKADKAAREIAILRSKFEAKELELV